jgi:hypothetical protein
MSKNIYHSSGKIAYRSDGYVIHENNQVAYRPSDGWAFHYNNQVAYRRSDGWAFHYNNVPAYRSSDGFAINENNQVISRDGSGVKINLGPGIDMFVGHNTFKLWVNGTLVVSK